MINMQYQYADKEESVPYGSISEIGIICGYQRTIAEYDYNHPLFIQLSPTMHFPVVSEKPEKRMVQEGNYEYFINTMAAMIHKYAPDLAGEMRRCDE